MVKKAEIFESKPYKVFEGRVIESYKLLALTHSLHLSKKIVYTARRQFTVSLVTCFETYLKDMYKLMIDHNLIGIENLYKIKKLRELKYTIFEMHQLRKDRI